MEPSRREVESCRAIVEEHDWQQVYAREMSAIEGGAGEDDKGDAASKRSERKKAKLR